MKIFVSGLYCSGKTTFAKKIAERNNIEYISFDDNFKYTNKNFTSQAKHIFNMLGDRHFIMDAIPFNNGPYAFEEFDAYYEKHRDANIIFVFCPNFDIWLQRLEIREKKVPNYENCKKDYYYNNRTFLTKLKDKILFYYDSRDNEIVDSFEFKKLTAWLDKNDS